VTNVVHDSVRIASSASIGNFNLIGERHQRLAVKYASEAQRSGEPRQPVVIGDRTVICNHVTLYEGVVIGEDAYIDDYVRVGARTRIGNGTMLLYGVHVYDMVSIGEDCRIAGFVPGGVVIGDNVTMMGTIGHKYDRPLNWFRDEPSPVFEDEVVVGLGALIVGGITIGAGSYIAANATVTKAVPPDSVVIGINQVMSTEEFERRKLARKSEGRAQV
jgi:acetyltransferase-like isoleucine patch superfamily enzyme